MSWVRVRVEQADRDGFDPFCAKVVENPGHPAQVERMPLCPVLRQAPGDLAPEVSGDEGRRLLVVEIEVVRPVPARDFEGVPKAFGRDQAGLDALPLGQCVDHERRAVREERDVGNGGAALRHHVHDTPLEVRRRRLRFRRHDLLATCLWIGGEVDEVGEGAPDVGRRANRAAHRSSPTTSSVTGSRTTP